MRLGSAEVIRADARALPIANNSVDLICTSPPYLNLRSYQDSGSHYSGQIGSETSQAEFLDALLKVTRECVRVLKPAGSIFVNLGDSYRDKSLQLTPHRYAARCVDELGLILRAEICWSKPNGLPESVTDRVRRSHEFFFHFTLSPRYFSAVDEIREATTSNGKTWEERKADGVTWTPGIGTRGTHMEPGQVTNGNMAAHPLGKLPGSVWTVPTEPLRVPDHLGIDHFAAFPTEWPKRIIAGWSPAGVCVACGEGRRPVVDRERFPLQAIHNGHTTAVPGAPDGRNSVPHGSTTTITGYACACAKRPQSPAYSTTGELVRNSEVLAQSLPPTTPAVVLDPFSGTGTVPMVAKALGRHGIGVDMSADYCRLARWRTTDRNQLAKVLGVAKAEQQDADQMGLFDMDGGAA